MISFGKGASLIIGFSIVKNRVLSLISKKIVTQPP
jgi:hypothetical protein